MADHVTGLALGAEFPPANHAQWLALVEETLKGASFDKRLVSHTYDGLRIAPLYDGDPSASPLAGRAAGTAWDVMQRVEHPDPAAANRAALQDLEGGASGIAIVFAGAIGAYGFGIEPSAAALERALEGVLLDAAPVEFDLGPAALEAAVSVGTLLRRRGIAAGRARVRFGFDPIGALAASGHAAAAWPALASEFVARIRQLADAGMSGPFAVGDGRAVHAAGGSEAQELAFALASATAYVRALDEAGVPLAQARRMIFFRLAADADQFLTLAKFRALRKLWARIESACGLEEEPVFVSAETAWRMMTRRDPWVNMLRTTVAAFAAGLGGADAVTVLPFTAALGLPDPFARRMARNLQLILQEESHLAKVADPSAGSGAMETLTRQLCEAAWALFQEIEAAGGAAGALERGLIQEKVAAARAARETAVARRKDAITGTSEFPNLADMPVRVEDAVAVRLPAPDARAVRVAPLEPMRLAEPFEALRDASDRMLAERGARPRVFLANLGTLAAFTARATFARNFFEAGGIEAVTNDGFASAPAAPTDLAALTAAFRTSGAAFACLCSSDEVYGREAAAAAQALTSAGARHIYLAGRGGEAEAALRAASVGTFIHVGCDVLGTLRAAYAML